MDDCSGACEAILKDMGKLRSYITTIVLMENIILLELG